MSSSSPLGLPVTKQQQTCQYTCDKPAIGKCERLRPCGHRVLPDILVCDEHAALYANTSAEKKSRCGFRGCLGVNQIRLSTVRPL